MAIKVGTLQVDLVANTASFTGPLDKAGQHAKTTAKGIQDGFNGMDLSEARGGLILVDDLIGIHMPRHAASFISQVPGFAAAFKQLFPYVAVLVAAKAMFDFAEGVKKHREEMQKAGAEALDAATAMGKHAESVHLSNLRLQDQIEILGHKMPQNGVRIAMEEAKRATTSLIDEIGKAIDKEVELLGKQEKGVWAGIFSSGGPNDILDKAKEFKMAIDQIVRDRTVAEQNGNTDEVAKQDGLLKTKLAALRKYADDQRTMDDVERAKQLAAEEAFHAKHVENFAKSLDAQNKSAAANARLTGAHGAAESANIEKGINEVFDQRRNILQDIQILDGNINKAQAANAQHNSLENDLIAAKDQRWLDDAQKRHGKLLSMRGQENLAATQELAIAGMLAAVERTRVGAAQQLESADMQRQQRADNILKLTTEIADAEASHNDRMAVAQGLITEQMSNSMTLVDLTRNRDAFLAGINGELDAQINKVKALGLATMNGMTGTGQQKAQYDKAVNDYQSMEERKLQATKTFNAQVDAERLKAANNERSQWNKMALDFSLVQTHMSQAARQMLGQMNSSIASFVTTGTGNFRQLATNTIASFIQTFLQYEESKAAAAILDSTFFATKKVLNAADAGSSASAAAAATLADVPYPENIPASAEVLGVGLGYAAGAAALQGALLPNREMLVNTHPEEMILPRNISNFIVSATNNASGRGGNGGGGDTNHYHFINAPTVHATDAEGLDRVLTNNADVVKKHFMAHARRMNAY